MRENEALIFVIMILTTAALLLAYIISGYARRRLESKEVLKALEHGRPLPRPSPKPRYGFRSDLRTGILMVCFAIGFGLFLVVLDNGGAVMVAAIPLFIGGGYLINAFVNLRLGAEDAAGGTSAATTLPAPIASHPAPPVTPDPTIGEPPETAAADDPEGRETPTGG